MISNIRQLLWHTKGLVPICASTCSIPINSASIISTLIVTTTATVLTIWSTFSVQAKSDMAPEHQNQGAIHYVSKNGSNQGGDSWQSAWNELDQINWGSISPGDTIVIDGGSSGMTYSTALEVGRSGSSGNPIRITSATESGRNGKVTLFGGRSQSLPYCGQSNFSNEAGLRWFGIKTNDHSWIEIDGRQWRGITVHGFERAGIRIDRGSNNITIRNVEIYNNGYGESTGSGWAPEGVGLRLGGENVLLERAIIHDNGQDAIQSLWDDNNIRNFRMNYTWLHNSRRHPSVNEAFNYCTHTDGIQIYDGGVIQDITIENSIIGPGFTQPLIMGQAVASNGVWADVQNVVIRDTLINKATDNAVYGYRDSNSRNWHFERVTLDCATTRGECIYLMNSDHSIEDSVIYKGRVVFPNGLNNYDNNCVWQNEELIVGRDADPQFVNASPDDRFSLDDYSIPSSSACAGLGSRITSVQQLLGTSSNSSPLPLPTSSPTAFPSPVPTADGVTPIPTPLPTGTPTPEIPTQGSGSSSCGPMVQEAESGLLTGDFVVETSSAASGGQYIVVPSGNSGAALNDSHKSSYCFSVPTEGWYAIKGWIYAETKQDNSFYLRIDGSPSEGTVWHTQVHMSFDSEYATDGDGYTRLNVFLTEGDHIIDVLLREDGARLDKIGLEPVQEVSSAGLVNVDTNRVTAANVAHSAPAQWLSGAIKATLLRNNNQEEKVMPIWEEGLALVDSETNGELARFALETGPDGSYYIDAVPVGRYNLKLPVGYGFADSAAPEVEISAGKLQVQEFEFSIIRQQVFLPLLQ